MHTPEVEDDSGPFDATGIWGCGVETHTPGPGNDVPLLGITPDTLRLVLPLRRVLPILVHHLDRADHLPLGELRPPRRGDGLYLVHDTIHVWQGLRVPVKDTVLRHVDLELLECFVRNLITIFDPFSSDWAYADGELIQRQRLSIECLERF